MITQFQGSAPHPKGSRLTLRPINTRPPEAKSSPTWSIQDPDAWLREHSSLILSRPDTTTASPAEELLQWLKENSSGLVPGISAVESPIVKTPYELLK